jgi:hypothetical protein
MPPWPNCLLLVAPLLAFNGLFTARLPAGLHHDEGVPPTLLLPESALRVVVFVAPLWLPLSFDRRGPLILFAVGSVLYLLSWIPALRASTAARRAAVYLLPYATPLIWLLAVAWMGASWPFAGASLVFFALHVTHGVLAHRNLEPA